MSERQARKGPASATKRAPRRAGPRTTLRLPDPLAAAAERVGRRQGISRNDAVVRLAQLGAIQQQRLDAIALRGEKRLVAWRERRRPSSAKFPSADEFEAAVALARAEDPKDAR